MSTERERGTYDARNDEESIDWLARARGRSDTEPDQKGQWLPYEGPRGGQGWRNTETGEIAYQEDAPGEPADVDNMGIEELGDALAAAAGEDKAIEVFAETEDEGVVRDFAGAYTDPDTTVEGGVNTRLIGEGAEILHPKVGKATVAETSGILSAPMGPSAGYALTEDDDVLIMGGEKFADEDGLPDHRNVLDLSDVDHLRETDYVDEDAFDPADFDYTGSRDRAVSNTWEPDANETSPRLSPGRRQEFWENIEAVTRDGGRKLQRLTMASKKSSYSVEGQQRERAFLRAAGIDLPYRNDTINGAEPDEKTVAAAAKYREGSQEAFEQIHGGEETLHRGLSGTAAAALVSEVAANDGDEVEVETFGMTNFSTADGVAKKFARDSVKISRNVETDEVLAYTDLFSGATHEGEIAVEGGVESVPLEYVEVRNEHGDFVPIEEGLDELHSQVEDNLRRHMDDGVADEVLP